jgi:CubicO group peptidase (beta-lactamase class C family)
MAVGVVISGSITAAPAQSAHAYTTLAAKLDSVIERAIAEQRIVGAVVLVAHDGAVVYRRAAGHADRETGRALRENDIFRYASLSKPIVSAAALALVERGKLGLDDAVTKWLPWFRPRLADGSEATIRVHHLLTHTAGLSYGFNEAPDSPYHRAGISDGLDHTNVSLEENLRRLASVPLYHAPGAAWRYSLATDVLGAVVERAGGAPLPDVVTALVTGPLGLKDTHFHTSDTTRLITAYANGVPAPIRMREEYRLPLGEAAGVRFAPARALDAAAYPSGGAGMVGTAPEFLAFLEALRNGGAPILRPATVAEMTRNHTGSMAAAGVGPGWGFGLGFAVLEDATAAGTPQSPGSFWWGGAYGNAWWVDPARKLSVVALANTTPEGLSGTFPLAVRDAVYEALK